MNLLILTDEDFIEGADPAILAPDPAILATDPAILATDPAFLATDPAFHATVAAGSTRHARIADDRVRHVRRVLGKQEGDEIAVGELNGMLGRGRIMRLTANDLELSVILDRPSPEGLDVDLVLALPRPKFLGRILQSATTFGVRRLTLLQSERVEKSYWQSSLIASEAIARHLRLGLEQAGSTCPPIVEFRHHFGDFVEEELADRLTERPGALADAAASAPFPRTLRPPATLIVGPEGGFVPAELEALTAAGVSAYTLGPRILKVEVAVAACLSRCLPDHGQPDPDLQPAPT